MEETAVQPNRVPSGFHEFFPKMFALVNALDQSVAVNVALGVSAHRRVYVKKRHLVCRVGDRLAVDNKRVNFRRPRSPSRSVADMSSLGVGHAPRVDGGGDILLTVLAGDMVQETLLHIDVVVAFVGVGARFCRRRRSAWRDPAVQHQDDAGFLHELYHVRLVRNPPETSAPEPQCDRERELDAIPEHTLGLGCV